MQKKYFILLSCIFSVAIIVMLSIFLIRSFNFVNEGKFRMNDFYTISTVKVEENTTKKEGESQELDQVTLNLSQMNTIMISIASLEDEAKEIYLDQIKMTLPKYYENMILYENKEEMLNNFKENDRLYLHFVRENNAYKLEFNLVNKNFLKEVAFPKEVNELTYDATIMKHFGVTTADISFEISFCLNVIEKNGKVNKSEITLALPNAKLGENGMVAIKQDVTKFPFKIQ